MKTILVTGSSGFIGYHLVKSLLNDNNYKIIGIDNMNDYYDLSLKNDRLNNLLKYNNYNFIKCDINTKEDLKIILKTFKIVLFKEKNNLRCFSIEEEIKLLKQRNY